MYFNRDDREKPVKVDNDIAKIQSAILFIMFYSMAYQEKTIIWDILLFCLSISGSILFAIGIEYSFQMRDKTWANDYGEDYSLKYAFMSFGGLVILGLAMAAMFTPIKSLNALLGF